MIIRTDLYKGFVKLKGKVSIDCFKGVSNYKSYEEIKNEVKNTDFNIGGVIKEDYVLIDFDDEKQGAIALKILKDYNVKFVGYKTPNGYHFLFRNNGRFNLNKRVTIAIGLDKVDIKAGINDCYEALTDMLEVSENKFVRAERQRIDNLPDNELPDEAPMCFTPLVKSEDVYKMTEGDGRNDAIFRQIINIMNVGLTKEETLQCLQIMNKYVFAEPLSRKEFETVTRDDAFPETIFKDKNGKFNKVMAVEYFIGRYKIKKIQGALYIYDGRRYAPVMLNGDNLLNHYVYNALPTLKNSVRNDIIADIVNKLTNCEDETKIDTTHICFKNGLLNLKTHELEEHTSNLFVVNYIPHNYNPSAWYCDYNISP